MIIREEQGDDHAATFAVEEAAFGRPNEARLVDALRADASPSLSLVAEVDGRIAGHVFFSPMRIDGAPDAPPVGGLAPLAVHPDHQSRGLGSALVREGLARARELGWAAIFLLGAPDYYGRFGFELAAPRGLRYKDAMFDSAFQVIELVPDALHGCEGWAQYHDAFEATGSA